MFNVGLPVNLMAGCVQDQNVWCEHYLLLSAEKIIAVLVCVKMPKIWGDLYTFQRHKPIAIVYNSTPFLLSS